MATINRGKKTYRILDIWQQYVKTILLKQPGTFTRRNVKRKIANYVVYLRKDGHSIEIMNFDKFRNIVENWFNKARAEIVLGNCIQIKTVGKICMRRVERDFRTGRLEINWAASNKLGRVWSETEQKMVLKKKVFFTDKDYVRVGWHKARCLQHMTDAYVFAPTKTKAIGFKPEVAKAHTDNKFLRYKYLYYPIRKAVS